MYDGRGSVKKVVNGSTVVRDYEYDPYGNITKGAPLQERIYGYNGEEYTPQSGLIYLRARHYNPSTATFISEDTYAGDKTDPVTRNRYSFANNNPVMYQDPSGHAGLFSKVVGAVKSVATTVTKTVAKAANTVTTKVTTAAKTVANKVTATVQKAVSTAKTVVSTVKSTVSNVATKVTTAAKKVVNDAKVAVQKATTAVVNVVKNVVNTVVNTVTTAVSNAVSYVENGVKSVASYVEKATTEVRNNVTTAYNSVKSYVAEKVQTVTTKASELWEKAEDLGQKVMARCETAVAETVEKASRWWQDTKESVKTAVEKTQNFVEKIGDSIKEGLNECATKAKEGLNCLVEGAKGVWNAVTNFVEEHPFIATGILIVGLAALTFFTGGAASAIFLAATKGAIMGAISGFGSGVVTAGVKKLVHGDSYSFDDAVHDVGKSTFGGALFGAITGGTVEAGKQLWSKFGGKIKSALEKIANRGGSKTEVYYRTMSQSDYDYLRMTGELPSTNETFISEIKNNGCINKRNENNNSCIDNSMLIVMKDLAVSPNLINNYLYKHNNNYKNLYNRMKSKSKTITNNNRKNEKERINNKEDRKDIAQIEKEHTICQKESENNLIRKINQNGIKDAHKSNSLMKHINNIKIKQFNSNIIKSPSKILNSCANINKYGLSLVEKKQINPNSKKDNNKFPCKENNSILFNYFNDSNKGKTDKKNINKYFKKNKIQFNINNKNILKSIKKIIANQRTKNNSLRKFINTQKLTDSTHCILDTNSLNENETKKMIQSINPVKSISISNNQFFKCIKKFGNDINNEK